MHLWGQHNLPGPGTMGGSVYNSYLVGFGPLRIGCLRGGVKQIEVKQRPRIYSRSLQLRGKSQTRQLQDSQTCFSRWLLTWSLLDCVAHRSVKGRFGSHPKGYCHQELQGKRLVLQLQ